MDSSQFRELQAMLLESEARLASSLSATIEAAVNKLFDERFAKLERKIIQSSPNPTEFSNSNCPSKYNAETMRVHIKTIAGELPPVELSCSATVADLKRMIAHEPSVNKRRRLLLLPDSNPLLDYFDRDSQTVVELVDDDQTLQKCGMQNGSGVNLVVEDFRAMNPSDQRLVNSCFDIKNLKLSMFEELINQRSGCLEIDIDLLFNHTAKLVVQILKRNRTVSEVAIMLPEVLNDAGIHSLDSILEAFQSNTTNISSLSLLGEDSFHDGGVDRLPLKTCAVLCELFRRNTNLDQVAFHEIYFDLNRFTAILEGLKQNLQMTKLHFFEGRKFRLCSEVRSALCDFLVPNTIITDFTLSCDQFQDGEHIVRVIQHNTSITLMDLSGDIDWSSESVPLMAEALATNTTLTYLDLGSCDRRITGRSRLRSRERSVVFQGISDLASALKRNQTLKHLFLYERRAAEPDVKSLAEALQQNNTLTEFDFPTFTHLFDRDFCTPVFNSAIKLNTSLNKLRLFENFSSVVATSFAEAIQQSTCITDLNLSSCEFPVDGAMAFANALRTNKSLLSLNINYVVMQPVGVSAVLEAISANSVNVLTNLQAYSIHQLSSHTYNIPTDLKLVIDLLEQNTQLTCLNFGGNGCGDWADHIAAAVQKNTRLTDFSFAANYFEDRGASAFASMLLENSTLQRLDLARNKMSRCGFQSISQALRRNTSLKYLRISSDHLPTSDLDFLFSEEQLKKLHFQVDVVKQR